MIAKLFRLFFVCFLILLFSGCGALIKSHVDSISGNIPTGYKNYVLLPGDEKVEPNDLQFREYAGYIEKALLKKGYVRVKNYQNADVLIFLIYGIGDPEVHEYSYSVPHWGQTGVSSSFTSGTLNTYGTSGTYSGFTTYTPKYGITGYTQHTGTKVRYFRYFQLSAIDFHEYKESSTINELWNTSVTSTGRKNDLRLVFPYMVVAAEPYIGTNTGRKVQVILSKGNTDVKKLKEVE